MTDNIKLPLVATSDHPEFPVLAWSPLELAEINRLMREAVRLNAALPDYCDVSCATHDLASMILSDCGCSSNYQPLLDRVAARIEKHIEAVRLNAQAVPDGWVLVPVQATPDMCKAAVIYANGNAVYKNVAHEALEIEESIYSEVYDAMLSAAPAAPQPAQQPLTDQQCDAIYMALDNWAREFDEYEFGLPHSCGGGVEGGREIIRQAHGIGVRP